MTALMKLLLDTLPMSAVACSLRGPNVPKDRKGLEFDSVKRGRLLRYLTFLDPVEREHALFKGWDAGSTGRIWSIDKASLRDPASVVGVRCQVPGKPKREYTVFDRVAFGRQKDAIVDPSVRIYWCGKACDLPLSLTFLWAQWAVQGAELGAGENPLWLATKVDFALQRVFVFDLTHNEKGDIVPIPLKELTVLATSPNVVTAEDMRLEYREVNQDKDVDGGPLELTRDIDFFPFQRSDSPSCAVAQTKSITVYPARVVVSCSLTLCEPSTDYDPTGAALVARFYPHIMVTASVDLDSIESAVQLDRPAASRDPVDPKALAGAPIEALLVAHANQSAIKYATTPPAPLCDSILNYYQPAKASLLGRRLTVVDRGQARKGARSNDSGWFDRTQEFEMQAFAALAAVNYGKQVNSGFTQPTGKLVAKVDSQGAFDGVCIAAKGSVSSSGASWSPVLAIAQVDAQPDASWMLNNILMMPLLGQDHVYFGWRWSDSSTLPSTWGWNDQGPYQVGGAPMVPPWQQVAIALPTPVSVQYAASNNPLTALRWTCFVHHGGAFSIDDGALRGFYAGSWFSAFAGTLTTKGGNLIADDSALLSWRMRFATVPKGLVHTVLEVKERVTFTLEGLEKAMAL